MHTSTFSKAECHIPPQHDWTVHSLRQSEKKLVYIIYDVGFGRIDGLLILAGEPQYDPAPTVTQTIRLDPFNPWRPPPHNDFKLKAPFVHLFTCTRTYSDETYVQITINGGLPTQMERRNTYTSGTRDRSAGLAIPLPHAN